MTVDFEGPYIHTHTHTQIYIYIYIHTVQPPSLFEAADQVPHDGRKVLLIWSGITHFDVPGGDMAVVGGGPETAARNLPKSEPKASQPQAKKTAAMLRQGDGVSEDCQADRGVCRRAAAYAESLGLRSDKLRANLKL